MATCSGAVRWPEHDTGNNSNANARNIILLADLLLGALLALVGVLPGGANCLVPRHYVFSYQSARDS